MHLIARLGIAASLAIFAASAAAAGDYAPLNCSRATTATERTICTNYNLGQSEARVATLYQWTTALVAMGQRDHIADEQAAFLKLRADCGSDAACIARAYDARIHALEAVMNRIKEQGPF